MVRMCYYNRQLSKEPSARGIQYTLTNNNPRHIMQPFRFLWIRTLCFSSFFTLSRRSAFLYIVFRLRYTHRCRCVFVISLKCSYVIKRRVSWLCCETTDRCNEKPTLCTVRIIIIVIKRHRGKEEPTDREQRKKNKNLYDISASAKLKIFFADL